TLWQVDASYLQISGFEFTNSEGIAFNLGSANYNYVYECIAHDNWLAGFQSKLRDTNTYKGNVFHSCEAYRNRRDGGFVTPYIDTHNPGFWKNNAIVECMSHDQGYQPDGQQVLPFGGDPYGGGNSGGIMQSKDVANADPTSAINYGDWNFVVRCIAFHNTADGF